MSYPNVIVVKAIHGSEIRKWKQYMMGMSELVNVVCRKFEIGLAELRLKYKDSDGDHVELANDEDLKLAIELEKTLVLIVSSESGDASKSCGPVKSQYPLDGSPPGLSSQQPIMGQKQHHVDESFSFGVSGQQQRPADFQGFPGQHSGMAQKQYPMDGQPNFGALNQQQQYPLGGPSPGLSGQHPSMAQKQYPMDGQPNFGALNQQQQYSLGGQPNVGGLAQKQQQDFPQIPPSPPNINRSVPYIPVKLTPGWNEPPPPSVQDYSGVSNPYSRNLSSSFKRY